MRLPNTPAAPISTTRSGIVPPCKIAAKRLWLCNHTPHASANNARHSRPDNNAGRLDGSMASPMVRLAACGARQTPSVTAIEVTARDSHTTHQQQGRRAQDSRERNRSRASKHKPASVYRGVPRGAHRRGLCHSIRHTTNPAADLETLPCPPSNLRIEYHDIVVNAARWQLQQVFCVLLALG